MLCGHVPYHNFVNDITVIAAVIQGVRLKKPENATQLGFTETLWDIVRQCWREDWSARPSVEDVLSCLNGAPTSWRMRGRQTVRKAFNVFFQ